jgi:hypothetical protein
MKLLPLAAILAATTAQAAPHWSPASTVGTFTGNMVLKSATGGGQNCVFAANYAVDAAGLMKWTSFSAPSCGVIVGGLSWIVTARKLGEATLTMEVELGGFNCAPAAIKLYPDGSGVYTLSQHQEKVCTIGGGVGTFSPAETIAP